MADDIVIITQARFGSTRLPGKVLKKINDVTLLEYHVNRLSKSRLASKVIVATTVEKSDNTIADFCKQSNISFYRGSENDVLDRYYKAALPHNPKLVVRVTSDCPLIDHEVVDEVIQLVITSNKDYVSNTLLETFPDGQDVEVFKFSALKDAWTKSTLPSEREHVTPYIKKHSTFNKGTLYTSTNLEAPKNYNNVRLTVDEPQDFEVIKKLINVLGSNEKWLTYTQYYLDHESIRSLNSKVIRNEGYLKSLKQDEL